MVLVGTVARPHGLKGHVVVNPETDFVDERFAAGATLWTRSGAGEAQLTVTESRRQGNRPVVAFAGVGSVEDAQQLAGQELRVPETSLQPLAPGRYYEHQLAGCAVVDAAGQAVGVVARVEGGAGSSRLVVTGDRGEILVPLAEDICREIDVAARRIVVELPEGLLELNEVRRRDDLPGHDRRGARGRGRQPGH
ncbi:MAG: ribosome maturation factor RimM [Vicinamibacterales bacterium]